MSHCSARKFHLRLHPRSGLLVSAALLISLLSLVFAEASGDPAQSAETAGKSYRRQLTYRRLQDEDQDDETEDDDHSDDENDDEDGSDDGKEHVFTTNAKTVKSFPWTKPTKTMLEAFEDVFPNAQGFWDVTFKESARQTAITWSHVVSWLDVELLDGPDPFKAHKGEVPVPWDTVPEGKQTTAADQIEPGQYVAYSRRQICFIVAKTLIGSNTDGYNNGLARYLSKEGFGGCVPKQDKYAKALFALLAACAGDPSLSGGKQGPMVIVAKPQASTDLHSLQDMSRNINLADAGLRLCRFDDGHDPNKALLAGVPAAPEAVCQQPTTKTPGVDFMSPATAVGQAVQDMSQEFLGGHIYGAACAPSGGQDERLLMFMPEASVLAFFLSQAEDKSGPPQLRQPAVILGARMLLKGLDGTARFEEWFKLDSNAKLVSDLVSVNVGGKNMRISTSKPLFGFGSGNQDMLGSPPPAWKVRNARLNKQAQQRDGTTGRYSFGSLVTTWYVVLSLTSYSADLTEALQKTVRSVGSGPWSAGLTFGDSQLGILAMWIAHALAVQSWGGSGKVPLDYYLYSAFTENPGNQCLLHSMDNCKKCLWRCNSNKPPPSSFWMPDTGLMSQYDRSNPCVNGGEASCPAHGLEDVMWNFGLKRAGLLWQRVEEVLQQPGDASKPVFDLLIETVIKERLDGLSPPKV